MANEGTASGSDELIRRARDEAQRRLLESGNGHSGGHVAHAAPEPPAGSWAVVHHAIIAAERHATVGTELPPMHSMRGLRRRVAVPLAKMVLRLARLFTAEQTTFNRESIGAIRALNDAVSGHLRTLAHQLAAEGHQHDNRLSSIVSEQTRQRRAFDERLREVEAAEADRRTAAVETAVAAARGEAVAAVAVARGEAAARIDAITQSFSTDLARLRTLLTMQERRLSILLDDARRAGSGAGAGRVEAEEVDHLLDSFYIAFEDQFRGPRDEIKARALPYLDLMREAGAGTAESPIIDLGCGRGEWLELLAENGLVARGVDLNRVAVEENRERGLDVTQGDGLTYLRALPDRSCGAVTGIHVIEHVPFAVMIRLFDETLRVLRPGGVAVFETPNPCNLLVGASRFYVDPTHNNPLHPDTMAFIAEARGLVRVGIRYLHPVGEEARFPDDGSMIAQQLNEYLRGPQDFAVIGYRP